MYFNATNDLVDPLVRLLNWGWLDEISLGSIIIRLFLGVICGGIIGVERAKKHHAAGFRTYILVCIGATIAMTTNSFLIEKYGSGDSARLGAQVISGIGFLGAGTILVTSRNQIKGLTTAAGLWACACLGLAIGAGFYSMAILGVLLIVIVLAILPKIEEVLTKRSRVFEIHIEFECRENLKTFVNYVRNMGFKIRSIEHNPAYSSSGLSVYSIILINEHTRIDRESILQTFDCLEYVNYVEEIK